ncbi:sugar phosphate isomerase/epimerase [Haloarcula sp. CBA1130]|uniref:sugar phosphate isomerase/epimerase family protein n=1 Tax=unclassified Haloarcula TaxID=2624677 RepID=UPI0012483F01|nr:MULTISPECIES: sugar phosphate isomerase/epimerase [unclassified Haloarcula]KAA9398485.1 sugar phosphate isomerase/epimerase [Haloarcula sp. CBA1129]KAA9401924.1 sugar phosphate isomerase/epimerase [Haloarcula sp. CBA1130]
MRTAIQLWTLRDLRERLSDVLGRIAAAGYDGVEFAGIGDPGASRRALDETGLGIAGVHVQLEDLQSDPRTVRNQVRTLDAPYLVLPYLDDDHFASESAIESTATLLGMLAADFDRPLLYHNHDHEFVPLGDGTAFDALVDQTSIGFEFDAGWAHAAGQDPVALIRRLDGRVPVVHLKDMTEDGEPTALGEGVVPLQAVVDAARGAGTEWLVFEHDDPENPVDAIQSGIDGMRPLLE